MQAQQAKPMQQAGGDRMGGMGGMGGNLGFGGGTATDPYGPSGGASNPYANATPQAKPGAGGFGGGSSNPYANATPQAKPGMQQNPYLAANGQAIVDQANQNLNNTIMPGIRSGAQAAGQYGGSSRQGIAEGVAGAQATTGIAGALSQLYGNAYNTDQANETSRIGLANQYDLGLGQLGLGAGTLGLADRTQNQQYALGVGNLGVSQGQLGLADRTQNQQFALGAGQLGLADRTAQQQFGLGVGQLGLANRNSDQSFALGVGQLGLGQQTANQNFALGAGQLGLSANTANQNFYTAQRGQDLQQYGIGSNLFQAGVQGNLGIGAGQYGLGQTYQNAPLQAIQQYSNTISPYSGLNSTQAAAPGGGVSQALGGALAGYQLYNNFSNYNNRGNATQNLTAQGQDQGWM